MKIGLLRKLLLITLLLFGATSSATAQSCRETAGAAKAQKLARQCVQVSEATHPPCNVANPCDMMVDEIKRSCAMRRDEKVVTPAFCASYSK
jgi:hypothetical protein